MRSLAALVLAVVVTPGALAQNPDSTAAILPGCQAHLQGRHDRQDAEGSVSGALRCWSPTST